jgi:hypothetical protein
VLLAGAAKANYALSQPAGLSADITPKGLTVTADNKSKIFDGGVFTAFTSTIAGFVSGENESVVSGSATYTGAATTAVNPGNYTITPDVSGLHAANYTFAPANGTLTILTATLLVSISESPEGSGDFIVGWQVAVGRTYRFQWKANLLDSTWTTLLIAGQEDFTATESSVSISHAAGAGALHGFYRVLDVTP